jgi:hypothetical protein
LTTIVFQLILLLMDKSFINQFRSFSPKKIGQFFVMVFLFFFAIIFLVAGTGNNGKKTIFSKASEITNEVVYSDTLSTDWQNLSVAKVDLASNAQVYSGTKAISFLGTSSNADLYFNRPVALTVTSLSYVTFAVRAVRSGQQYSIILMDDTDKRIGKPIPLSKYIKDIPATQWAVVQIPLIDLTQGKPKIKGLLIEGITRFPQPALFIDSIEFKSGAMPSLPAQSTIPTKTETTSPTVSLKPYLGPTSIITPTQIISPTQALITISPTIFIFPTLKVASASAYKGAN